MSFGRGSRSRLILPVWAERAFIALLFVLALGLVYSVSALVGCVLHAWCPR